MLDVVNLNKKYAHLMQHGGPWAITGDPLPALYSCSDLEINQDERGLPAVAV